MPLLSDIYTKVAPHHRLLTCAAYIAAFVCVTIFPSFDRRTEIEEHGLIPGYATAGFEGEWGQRLRSLISHVEQSPLDVPSALEQALEEADLTRHRMNFTTQGGLRSSLTYTVSSSRRGDSREAVVLVIATHWTASKRAASRAAWGVAIGITLAQYFKTVPWLSKDVITVFVDGSLPYGAGARAWLRAYFGGSSAIRRGVLRQAVVLDTASRPSAVLCDVEGVNGMVPNQDVVNAYMLSAREKRNLPAFHREVWESLYHHIRNGGVHSSHAPFLDSQVPAFTVRGQRTKSDKGTVDVQSLAQSLEGIVRCLSNNLQQLHHSFNFYFFTDAQRHISSGLYLYPVFAMQLPLISFLMTTPAYRDIRSFLVGLGTIAVIIVGSGSPIFLLATNAELSSWLAGLVPGSGAAGRGPPSCLHPDRSPSGADLRHRAAATWLTAGGAAAALVCVLLRRYAFTVFDPADTEDASTPRGSGDAGARSHGKGVRLPSPLWDAIRCSSGFAFLVVLAPITIYSWALAVPLTVVCVPIVVLVRPFNFRRRPTRSLLLLSFLLANAFMLAVHPALRAQLLGGIPGELAESAAQFFEGTVVPSVPREARPYLPLPLVRWLRQGQLAAGLGSDLLVELYEAARDFNCVGGMLFPVFCFVYWPLLVVLALVGAVLPEHWVEEEGLSMRQLRLGALMALSLVVGGVVGGVVWRSYSSSGLGELQW